MNKRHATPFITAALVLGLLAWSPGRATGSDVVLQVDIEQNMEMILYSMFGEPAQYAIWLESVDTGATHTVSVTYRSATGDWVGKVACPVALPGWFAIYREEKGAKGLPRPGSAMPDAVTRATPQTESFRVSAPLTRGTRWIAWIEVNIAADFNEAYPQFDERRGRMDSHFDGQPALLYRAEIEAAPGAAAVPEIFGKSVVGSDGKAAVERDTSGITTASEIFPSIRISVLDTPPTP